MFKVVHIRGKKYLFLQYSQTILGYSDKLLGLAEKVKNDIEVYGEDYDKYDMDENYKMIFQILLNEKEIKKKLEGFYDSYISRDEVDIKGSQINVIHGCNLACKYCFASQGTHGKNGRMTSKTARKVVDFIKYNSKQNRLLNLAIIGGESFLNMEVFEEIVNYSEEQFNNDGKKVYIQTTTNGTLMDKNIYEFFKKHNIYYMVSLDSHKMEVNDFLRPSRNKDSTYEMCMNNCIKINNDLRDKSIHITVTPYNKNISEIAENLFDLGIYDLHFEEVISDEEEFLFTEDDIRILKNEYEKLTELIIRRIIDNKKVNCHPIMTNIGRIHNRRPIKLKCGALTNLLAFDTNGGIYPCDMLMWDDYNIGDIENGIDKTKLSEIKNVLGNQGKCKECWGRYLCGGECLSEKLWENEEQKKLRCKLKKHIFKLRIYMYEYIRNNCKDFDFDNYII